MYLLDANAVIAVFNRQHSPVAARMKEQRPADIAVSAIMLHELYYGAFKSARSDRNLARVDELSFEVLNFTRKHAREAGEVRAMLAAQGTPIGPYDVLIAG